MEKIMVLFLEELSLFLVLLGFRRKAHHTHIT
jgi:hypothetical protein